MTEAFAPDPKRVKRTRAETKAKYNWVLGSVFYDETVCDPETYPKLEKKKFPRMEDFGVGIDPEGTGKYYYAVYDAIQHLDKSIELLEDAQSCVGNWDVRDPLWEAAYNGLTEMRNDWVDQYEVMRQRAIKSKNKKQLKE
jgi:hypothetical protein